jgi:hypothetical protein
MSRVNILIAAIAIIVVTQSANAQCITQEQIRRARILQDYDAFMNWNEACLNAADSINRQHATNDFLAGLFEDAPSLATMAGEGGYCHLFAEHAYLTLRSVAATYPAFVAKTKRPAKICRDIEFQVVLKKLSPWDAECRTINIPCAQALYDSFL